MTHLNEAELSGNGSSFASDGKDGHGERLFIKIRKNEGSIFMIRKHNQEIYKNKKYNAFFVFTKFKISDQYYLLMLLFFLLKQIGYES